MASANKVPNININRKVDDPFYRYKMPTLLAKVEGRGNGIKTVIPNMVEIAKALDRPPTYPTKYFGCELGAQTLWDEKAERYIVNGAHQAADLQNLLDGFIEKFVLCPECANPETRLKVVKKNINQKCAACGFSGPLKTAHRLTTFIVNHPPNADAGKGAGGKKGKRSRKAEEGEAEAEADGAAAGTSAALDNVAQRDGGQVVAPEVREVDEDDWSVDTSAEAVRKREEAQLAGAVSKLVLANDAEKTPEERLELFYDYVKERAGQEKFPAKDVLAYAERLECKEKGVMVLVELLLNTDKVVAELKRHQALLQRFTDGSKKAQKYMLHAFEKLVEHRPELMARVPNIFMALYELDIVEEMAFVSWGEKVSKKYVSRELSQKIHDQAAPFLKWLDEAEEEDEEDEDEDEDEAVEFDQAVSEVREEVVKRDKEEVLEMKKKAAEALGQDPAEVEEEDDDDDIDIDDI